MVNTCLVALLVVLNTFALDANAVPVTLSQGVIRGKTLQSRLGRIIFSFQGIPYAAPPIGKLRFKPPQAPSTWAGERPATRESPDCPQYHFFQNTFLGNEDCLYVNVYTPTLKSEEGLSVMVWIHGGGFYSGSGSTEMYGPELLLDHDVVLVTFNYRLDVLGFLSLNNEHLPGNYGLKDQVAALQWVQNNIAQFGGNPNSVTIFGESAGGSSVHYLMLSPLTKGLFHRAIAQSGCAINPWAFQNAPEEHGRAMITAVGCNITADSAQILECLQNVEAQTFISVARERKTELKKITLFIPTAEPQNAEGALISEHPRDLLARGHVSDVPFMTGLTTREGMLWFTFLKDSTPEEVYQYEQYNYLRNVGIDIDPESIEWKSMWQKIEKFYDSITNNSFIDKFLLLESDNAFVLGIDEMVRLTAALKRQHPLYYYQFSYDGGLNFFKNLLQIKLPGTSHADELSYLFSQAMMQLWKKATMKDIMAIGRMTKLWANFARTGNPTPDATLNVTWSPVDAEDPDKISTRFLDIGDQLIMNESDLNAQRLTFWTELKEHYYNNVKRDEL